MAVEGVQRHLALLALSADRDDRVALRWLLGFGDPDWRSDLYARLRGICQGVNISPWEALEGAADTVFGGDVPVQLVDIFRDIRAEIAEILNASSVRTVIDDLLPEGSTDHAHLREMALHVIDGLGDGVHSIANVVNALRREIALPEETPSEGRVRIMTLHKSKGSNAATVYMCGCVDELLPRQTENADPAEQRRLFYVGMTRVKADTKSKKPTGTLILTYSRSIGKQRAQRAGIWQRGDARHFRSLERSPYLRQLGCRATRGNMRCHSMWRGHRSSVGRADRR